MSAPADAPVYGLFLEFAETELIETTARADEAVRAIEQLDGVVAELQAEGVDVRGFYDRTGFGEYGSVLVWLRARGVTDLQWAQRQLRRTMMLGDTALVSARVVTEVTELDPEPSGWLNVVEAAEAPVHDGDFEYGEELFDDDLDVVEAAEAVDGDFIDEPEGSHEPVDASVDAPVDEPADADVPEGVDPRWLPGRALLSLHAHIGIGPLRYLVVAEADSAIGLVGELGDAFGDDLELEVLGTGEVGRLITTAELFEVLR